jgi:cytochrome c-type biogenesis protein CcsB
MPFVLNNFLPSAQMVARPSSAPDAALPSALKVEVGTGGKKEFFYVWGRKEKEGKFRFETFGDMDIGVRYGAVRKKLPFRLALNDFIIKRYPGSESPSWFESNVQLIDSEKDVNREERIYMNYILKHRGYRFYQSSYDTDEKGTVLSLNRDSAGTTLTYTGYLLMALGMLLSLLSKNSRFRKLVSNGNAGAKMAGLFIPFFLFLPVRGIAQETAEVPPEISVMHAEEFGRILVQDNGGRIEPLNTLASEVLRKVARKERLMGQSADQVFLGMMVYPEYWQKIPMIRAGHPEIQKFIGIGSRYASFVDFFPSANGGGYLIRPYVEEAYRKKPAYRNKFDNEIIRIDERVNICYLIYHGALLRIFPDPADTTHTWHSYASAQDVFHGQDSVFVRQILTYYTEEVRNAVNTGDWKNSSDVVKAIKIFQDNYGEPVIPSGNRLKAEEFYNEANIFSRITRVYLLAGLLLLVFQFAHIFLPRFRLRYISVPAIVLIAIVFLLHTFGLALRWYVAGHAPWSNGYEALVFIAWATVLAGLLFSRKSAITISATAILSALILQTAHLSWMDPQVTNLVPVLKSYWLIIHVAVITASYGFLGLGALVALVNLLLLFFETDRGRDRLEPYINKLTNIIEMTLIAGLYLLTIGTFLGGVWANESWGRYWAWDPKETWALVTVIVYAIILHLRLVPGLKGRVLFNVVSLVGFGSVIMTYFGVNYYLSGLHSYAQGDPLPVPPLVYYSVAVVLVLSALAAVNQYRLNKKASG